jgi:(p)ppGpp synthase/HD superfamily hydrolase
MRTAFSPRVDAALALAARAHRTQLRKGTDTPYIVHPVGVALILDRHGLDEDLVVAGLLHDTVEDTGLELEAIRAGFGDDVAALVDAMTERKLDHGAERPWRERKEEAIAHFATADARLAALKGADLLHNLQCTLADLKLHGSAVWARFNAGKDEWLWYYSEMASRVAARLGDHPLARELAAVLDEIARTDAASAGATSG